MTDSRSAAAVSLTPPPSRSLPATFIVHILSCHFLPYSDPFSSKTLIIPDFWMAFDLESTVGLPDNTLPSNAQFPATDLWHSPYIDTNLSLHGQLYNRNMSPLTDPMQNLNGCLSSNSSVSVLWLIYVAKNECFRACYPCIMPICLWSSYLVVPPRSNWWPVAIVHICDHNSQSSTNNRRSTT